MNVSKLAPMVFACGLSALLLMPVRAQAPVMPKDVYPDSRFRLPLPKRDDFNDQDKKVYDRIADPNSKRLAGLQGPAGIRLADPNLARIMDEVNDYLRYRTGFGDRLTEIAIMTAAREMDHQFEWAAHEKAGLKAGVPLAVVDIIKYRTPIVNVEEKEAVTIEFGRELFGQRKVSPETFADALRLYGRKGLVDLTALMSQYTATAALLTAFDMQLPPGQAPLLPVK